MQPASGWAKSLGLDIRGDHSSLSLTDGPADVCETYSDAIRREVKRSHQLDGRALANPAQDHRVDASALIVTAEVNRRFAAG